MAISPMSQFQPSNYSAASDMGGILDWFSSSSTSSAATPTQGAVSYYLDGEYVYLYLPSSGSITIVASPKSPTSTAVASGTSAYTAILSAIKSGKAKSISSEEAQKRIVAAAKKGKSKSSTSTFTSDTSAATALTSDSDLIESEPIYKKFWFLPAVLFGLVTVVGGIVIIRS